MCAEALKTLRLRVDGLVQGVGFRAFVVHRATELGVGGWVRNSPDGAVEIEAQAGARDMEQFLLDMRQGPRMAHVEEISVEDIRDATAYRTFDIRW